MQLLWSLAQGDASGDPVKRSVALLKSAGIEAAKVSQPHAYRTAHTQIGSQHPVEESSLVHSFAIFQSGRTGSRQGVLEWLGG